MLDIFAKMLGLKNESEASDALYSERAARLVLNRRGFMGASALLAVGTAFSFALPLSNPDYSADYSIVLLLDGKVIQGWKRGETIYDFSVSGDTYGLNENPFEKAQKVELIRVGLPSLPLSIYWINPRSMLSWRSYPG